jgi:hypothetical protein
MPPMGHLDERSQRALAGFAIRFAVLTLTTTSPGLLGAWPLGGVVGALQLACALGALLAVARAAARRAMFDSAALNAWDEALAFWASLMLLHWLGRVV